MTKQQIKEKTICIFEFSRQDSENECEWFIVDKHTTHYEKSELAYKHLLDTVYEGWEDDMTIKDVRNIAKIEGLYTVDENMITEVIESRK